MNKKTCKIVSTICFQLGVLSILLSIGTWWFTMGDDPDQSAHAERFGIFIGIWAPTLLILSDRFDRFAEKAPKLPGTDPDLHQGTDDVE